MSGELTLELLGRLVEGGAVAIRGRAELEPAGGPGDKVFPPSHSVDQRTNRPGAKYAFEWRRRHGADVLCVLLDSVQSQANRMEEALESLWTAGRIALPVIEVDLSTSAPDVGKVTSLTAPHRVADALLRDSLLEGTLFRDSTIGRSFTDATTRHAGPLFKVCPTALVFGLWDSTGPKGGLGAKFARVLVSEIVGIGADPGVKTASRIDPASIVTAAGPIFVSADPAAAGSPWTHDVLEARPLDPKKPPKNPEDLSLAMKWGSKDKAGKPSSINHSNVPPTIDALAGGVTIDWAEHTVVLSLAGLRRLGFAEGGPQARVALAALALVAVLAAQARGHDLRSRCLLVPRAGKGLRLESVAADGSTAALPVDLESAIRVYESAVKALPPSLGFDQPAGKPLAILAPSAKLAHLIARSRELAAAGVEIEDE